MGPKAGLNVRRIKSLALGENRTTVPQFSCLLPSQCTVLSWPRHIKKSVFSIQEVSVLVSVCVHIVCFSPVNSSLNQS